MRQGVRKILVTGGAGFIGSAFVRLLLRDCPRITKGLSPKGTDPELVVVDKLTYAGDLKRLGEINGKYRFYKADICDKKRMQSIFKNEKPDIVVHFAAETHVDRSILDSSTFIKTNVFGTQVLLDLSRKYNIKKFLNISSDEVYGDIGKGKFSEDSPLRSNSPYAASKAAADLLIRSYIRTYGFPAVIVRPCNNYGPWQFPEKLIPLAISKILRGENVPVYAEGLNVREWLYVEDCAEGILAIMHKGKLGQVYNLGSGREKRNIDIVKTTLRLLGKPKSLIQHVKDRPAHDRRYALNCATISRLGWEAKYSFIEGLKLTIDWYVKNSNWWQRIKQKKEYKLYYKKWYIKRN